MRQLVIVLVVGVAIGAAGMHLAAQPGKVKGGFIVQHDADIAKNEPGTHDGGGQTIGYSFFDKTPGMKFIFRKRALHAESRLKQLETRGETGDLFSGDRIATLEGENRELKERLEHAVERTRVMLERVRFLRQQTVAASEA